MLVQLGVGDDTAGTAGWLVPHLAAGFHRRVVEPLHPVPTLLGLLGLLELLLVGNPFHPNVSVSLHGPKTLFDVCGLLRVELGLERHGGGWRCCC